MASFLPCKVVSRFIHHAYRCECVFVFISRSTSRSAKVNAVALTRGEGVREKPKCEIWPRSTYSLFSPTLLKHNTSAGELGQINYLKPRLYWLSALILRSLPLARPSRKSKWMFHHLHHAPHNKFRKIMAGGKETLLEVAPSLNNTLTLWALLKSCLKEYGLC